MGETFSDPSVGKGHPIMGKLAALKGDGWKGCAVGALCCPSALARRRARHCFRPATRALLAGPHRRAAGWFNGRKHLFGRVSDLGSG